MYISNSLTIVEQNHPSLQPSANPVIADRFHRWLTIVDRPVSTVYLTVVTAKRFGCSTKAFIVFALLNR